MELERISHFKLKELNINRAFLPIGTIEAHGPAPLGTDNYIPYILSRELAKEFNAIVLPTVSYGINKSLDYYLGSMGISERTFKSLVFDILKSCYKNKFFEIFIFNGHSGNSTMIKEASYKAHLKYGLKICIVEWWEIAKDIDFFKEFKGHAGIDEVAMVIYAVPEAISKIKGSYKSYVIKSGISNYPNPRSILIDRENIEYALDIEKSKEFFLLVKERIKSYILEVIEGWKEI